MISRNFVLVRVNFKYFHTVSVICSKIVDVMGLVFRQCVKITLRVNFRNLHTVAEHYTPDFL